MKRRGVILIEVIVAAGLLVVLLGFCVQLLALTALERRATERRAIALQEAANLMEQTSTLPYEELTSEKLSQLGVSEEVAEILPGAKATLAVEDEAGEVAAKRVQVALEWQGRGKRTEPPVQLVYWAYPPPPSDSKTTDSVPSEGGAQPAEDAS